MVAMSGVYKKLEDYFDIAAADAGGSVIAGITGLMHSEVLEYMKEAGPRAEGDYLFYADTGRLRYILFED